MDFKIKRRIEEEAKVVGICNEFAKLVYEASTMEDMVNAYKRGLDWALRHDFPSLPLLRDMKDEIADFGIFIDRHFNGETLDKHQVYVFHNCTGEIHAGLNVPLRVIPMLYFSSGCDMTVLPSGPSGMNIRVPLYVLEGSEVHFVQSEDVVFKKYRL